MFALTSPTPVRKSVSTRLARARRCTPQLFWSVLEEIRPHGRMLGADGEAIRRMVEAGAWIDAALALAKLELPLWTVRRLQLDGGEWHCSFSQHRDLPDWLDNAREAHHVDPALAILSALLEARAVAETSHSAPRSDRDAGGSVAVCCENFS